MSGAKGDFFAAARSGRQDRDHLTRLSQMVHLFPESRSQSRPSAEEVLIVLQTSCQDHVTSTLGRYCEQGGLKVELVADDVPGEAKPPAGGADLRLITTAEPVPDLLQRAAAVLLVITPRLASLKKAYALIRELSSMQGNQKLLALMSDVRNSGVAMRYFEFLHQSTLEHAGLRLSLMGLVAGRGLPWDGQEYEFLGPDLLPASCGQVVDLLGHPVRTRFS